MPRKERHLRELDRRYLKFKMKRIKKEINRGNRPAAQRHGVELIQYFGIGDGEMPIESVLQAAEDDKQSGKDESMSFRDKVNALK
jgi:hypothetical protein